MNEAVLNKLPRGQYEARVYAELYEYKKKSKKISFQYNPEAISYSREATYNSAEVAGVGVHDQIYYKSEGHDISIYGLLLDGWAARRSIKPILDNLYSYLDPAEPAQPPTQLGFAWGGYSIGPLVLTSVSHEETAWLNGEPAIATVNLRFTQVSTVTPEQQTAAAAPSGLTARQVAEGTQSAIKWLRENITNNALTDATRNLIRGEKFEVRVTPDGEASLFDKGGNLIKRLGRVVGSTFNPEL